MKVYLDDTRQAPEGWILVKTYQEAVHLLMTEDVTDISLDHDLGTDETGYDVIVWIERNVYSGNIPKPTISIHTSNPAGYKKMRLARDAIERQLTS